MAYRKSLDFLPSVFQTKTNDKTLRATVDQLISEPEVKQIDGYIGRRFNPALTPSDSYIQESYLDRQQYQLEPASVYVDDDGKVQFVSNYVDLLNRIRDYGGNTQDPNRILSADQYNYSSFFDFDKFVNYSSYYWLPNGPDSVGVFSTDIPTDLDIKVFAPDNFGIVDGVYDVDGFDETAYDTSVSQVQKISKQGYRFDITGNKISPVIRLARGGSYRFHVEQLGHGFIIQTEEQLKRTTSWQQNLNVADVYGVENNGEDIGTVTFNVPEKDEQDFFADMPVQGSVDLLNYSVAKKRKLRFIDIQNANYNVFVDKFKGIDGQRNINGKTIAFLTSDLFESAPQPWKARTEFFENDLVVYGTTIYRVTTDFSSGRTFSTVNLEIYTEDGDWFYPGLYDDTDAGFDGTNFDRGEDVPLDEQLSVWRIRVDDENIIRLTPESQLDVNKKTEVLEGVNYGNRDLYRTTNKELDIVPFVTANIDRLYYRDSIDPDIVGVIELVDLEDAEQINAEFIQTLSQYESPNGVVFENGLKVRFADDVSPIEYKDREFYIEGVGDQIKLLPVENFDTPEPWLETVSTPFDSLSFDSEPFDESQPAPIDKQYITINRSSREGSAWTRQNRWFHESVIENTSQYNNFSVDFDQSDRAKRPIIEFEPDLQLYNFGINYKATVSVVDNTETDAFSNVEGVAVETVESVVSGYYSDGVPLINGNTVIFANDSNPNIRNRIWRIEWITPESETNTRSLRFNSDGSSTAFVLGFEPVDSVRLSVQVNGVDAGDAGFIWSLNNDTVVFSIAPPDGATITVNYTVTRQIHLVEHAVLNKDDVVLSKLGISGQGKNWVFDGNTLLPSQTKTQNNQEPLFDLFDKNGNSVSDFSRYAGSNFAGNKLFGYKPGTGAVDSELGIRLSYRNIGNVGDIVFTDYINAGSFSYESETENNTTRSTKGLTVRKNKKELSEYLNQWTKNSKKTQQYQTQTFFSTLYQQNNFRLNITPDTLLPENIVVYKNNRPLTTADFDIDIISDVGYLVLNDDLSTGDKVDVEIFSTSFNSLSEWEIPSHYENNPFNQDLEEIALGQMRNHIVDAFVHTPDFDGEYQGKNNVKDLGNIKVNGGKIVQNAGNLHLANLFLNDTKANFVESILYSAREYNRFKNKFSQLAYDYPLKNPQNTAASVDEILKEISLNKTPMFPFHYSDMAPYGEDYAETMFRIFDTEIGTFFLRNPLDFSVSSNKGVLVYLNGRQLINGKNYVIDSDSGTIELLLKQGETDTNTDRIELAVDDVLTVREYSNTDGSHIPQTPSKLGLYPAFVPGRVQEKYSDKTYDLIRGHDGSLTMAYGDFRDDLLLELENRIYNNIKISYNRDLFDLASVTPGYFRNTDSSNRDFNRTIAPMFNSWLGSSGIEISDFTEFFGNDPFSWNYNSFTERLSGEQFEQANWRGIYKYYYDTDQPNLRPWEMLGFTEMPSWWQREYGPAPYTSGNSVLWDDLEQGLIKSGNRAGIDSDYARPGLKQIIPVDDSGNLLAPYQSLSKSNSIDVTGAWRFGDIGPVENVWRQSSEYPFAIQIAVALTRPAEYFGLLRNTEQQEKVTYGNGNDQWVFSDAGIRNKTEYVHGEVVDNQVVKTAGYINWISDYATGLGLDISAAVGEKLRKLKPQLSYKVSGYTDKKYVKVYADQSSPQSTNSSVLIPDDDFEIKLLKSSPRFNISYSGIIVDNTGSGYTVRGYNQSRPFFVAETGKTNGKTRNISVLNETVVVAAEGSGRRVTVPYGTEFATKQEVVDFIIGVGRHHESIGIIFDDIVPDGTGRKQDWYISAEEFLFWTQQGWGDNIAITLSPVGKKIKLRTQRGTVDSIENKPNSSRVLDKNFNIVNAKDYMVSRDGRNFELELQNDIAIHLAEFDVVDYEHIMIFNNQTRFNDIIYQPELGNRQFRLKLTGFKTAQWDGTFGAAGFIVNDNNINNWAPGKNYYKGEIVKFKEVYYVAKTNVPGSSNFDREKWSETEYSDINSTLLPNLANRAGQPKSFYDMNKTNLELDADRLGKGLIGFTPREYLNSLGITDTSQVKFYQGLITQKGSNNSINKMLRANLDNFSGSAEFYEQWAIRTGIYGATENINELKIPVDDFVAQKDPAVIEIVDPGDQKAPGRFSYTKKDLVSYNRPFDKNFLNNTNSNIVTEYLPSAGHPRVDEIKYFSFDDDELANSLDRTVAPGDRIWTANDSSNSWAVYRVTDTDIRISKITINNNGLMTVETQQSHDFSAGKKIYIKTTSATNLEKSYTINEIVNSNTFTVQTTLSFLPKTDVFAIIYEFKNVRIPDVSDVDSVTPGSGWLDGDIVYVDNLTDLGWGVYQKTSQYNTIAEYSDSESQPGDEFGNTVVSSTDSRYLIAASPDTSTVKTFRTGSSGELIEDAIFVSPSKNLSDFGRALTISDSDYAAIGSPESENTGFVHVIKKDANGSFILTQTIAAPNLETDTGFGKSLAISNDSQWLYIGQPDRSQGRVRAYQLTTAEQASQTAVSDGSTLVYSLNSDLVNSDVNSLRVVDSAGFVLYPEKDFDIVGSGTQIQFTSAPDFGEFTISRQDFYKYVNDVSVSGSSDLRFGFSISSNTNGSQLLVGVPGETNNSGSVRIFNRTIEKQFVAVGQTVFTTAVSQAEGEPLVKVDDIVQTESTDYVFNGTNNFQFQKTLDTGSIVTIESNNFIEQDAVENITGNEAGAQFGYSLDLCPFNCSLYIGAPFDDDSEIDSGEVHRYINQGRFFGKVNGTVENPSISTNTRIFINDYVISFAAGQSLGDIIDVINVYGVPGVTASSENNRLVISADIEIFADKLNFGILDGDFFSDVGVDIYAFQQIINGPRNQEYSSFGKAVKIAPDAQTLVIGSDRGSALVQTRFDNNQTTFDSSTTKLRQQVKRSGSVFVYEMLTRPNSTVETPVYFILAQELVPADIERYDEFGKSIAATNRTVFVGSPGNDYEGVANSGVVYGFTKPAQSRVWQIIRSQQPQVDIGLINKVYLYNSVRGNKITDVDIIDPIKGKISGIADQEISYKTSYDPAVYSSQLSGKRGNRWSNNHVGEIWWDVSLTRWSEYNQDDVEYRASNWGFAFPGSSVICAEWTRSDVPPEFYSDERNPNAYALYVDRYNIVSEYNERTQSFTDYYYFWVAGKTTVPRSVSGRRLSSVQIEELIADPRLAGTPFIAFYNNNTFGIYNASSYINNNSVLAIDYDQIRNSNKIHTEYQLISENDKNSKPSQTNIDKMIDSLAGQDRSGNIVPDIDLSDTEKNGISIRPRQTMFNNRTSAVREAVDYINRIMIKIPVVYTKNTSALLENEPLPDSAEYLDQVDTRAELEYLAFDEYSDGYTVLVKTDETVKNRWVIYEKTATDWMKKRIQSFNNARYIDSVEWKNPDVDIPDTFDTVVDFEYDLQAIIASEGDFVKVKDNGSGLYKIVRRSNNVWETVVEENGTLQINSAVYNLDINNQGFDNDGFGLQLFDDWPSTELYKILYAVYNDIFVGEQEIEKNLFFLAMIRHALRQDQNLDWAFKTSLIKVAQQQRALEQFPVYQKDNQDLIREYINEVKPYHTKISQYVLGYDGTEDAALNVTDFDLPAYYSFTTNSYRSPTGQTVEDDIVLDLEPWASWSNNYKLEISSVDIYHGGSGYITAPELTVSGGGGTGAKLSAKVVNGEIVDVVVDEPGSGYISAPTISITQEIDDPAILVPRLRNNKIRSFDTTIKFDRLPTNRGWLVEFRDSNGNPVDIRNETLNRLSGQESAVDAVLDVLSNGAWLTNTEAEAKNFPVENVPNMRIFNDSSGRVQFNKTRRPYHQTDIVQTAIRALGTDVGVNGLDLSGTIVTEDGSFVGYDSDILDWQPNFEYFQGEYLVHNSTPYAVTAQFTSGNRFSTDNLRTATPEEFETHLNRTWGFYQPSAGMLGKDLGQLFDGTEFPGNSVQGPRLGVGTGFDNRPFDADLFDNVVIGPEGVPVIDPITLDQTIYSKLDDVDLGTRPEDIITAGGQFVDSYHSHAPEEMIPGSVYDSMKLTVHTLSTNSAIDTQGFSPEFSVTNHTGDGSTLRFRFGFEKHTGDYLLVYSSLNGPRYRKNSDAGVSDPDNILENAYYDSAQQRGYAIDFSNNDIVFDEPPAVGEIINIINVGQIGQAIIADQVLDADGVASEFQLDIKQDRIGNLLVLVNGVETTDYVLGEEDQKAKITFNSVPAADSHIHVVASENQDSNTISKINTQLIYIEDDVTGEFELDENIRQNRSKDSTVIVELNGNRLRPGNTNYYDGDGSTTVFALPTTAKETYSSITIGDVRVWVNGNRQDLSDFQLSSADGSSIPYVEFFEAPGDNADISVTYISEADYFVDDGSNVIRLSETVSRNEGDLLVVKSFSDHDVYRIKTKVFVGTEALQDEVTVSIGFDQFGFDSFGFDEDQNIIVESDYRIDNDQNLAERVFISINGRHLIANKDYSIESGRIRVDNSIVISPTSEVVVTWFSPNIYTQATTFQIVKNANENFAYLRASVDESTELASELKITDDEIAVVDATVLEDPGINNNKPGAIFINGERITYYVKDGNTLKQIRRGTNSTGAPASHPAGTRITNAGPSSEIPSPENVWYNSAPGLPSDGTGLQNSTTLAAQFIKDKKGIIPL